MLSPRLTLGLICLAIFVGAVDLTVVTAVLPQMMLDLRVSVDTELNRAAWVISGYLLAYTISVAITGRLSDLLGRRAVYLVALVVFILGSAAVAAAPTLEWLVAARVIQAIGAGALVPVAMALVGDLFPQASRAAALGFIGAVDTAGWMVGHLYGGVLMRAFDDWRLLFWLNLPIGLVALVLTWLGLRHLPIRRETGRFDWLGALLLSGSLAALNIGLSAGAELGATDFYGERLGPPPYALPLVLLAVGLLAAFVVVERRSPHPLIDPRLFTQARPLAAGALNLISGFVLALALTNVPLFITTRIGLLEPSNPDALRQAAWDAGWMLSALTLTMAALSWPGGWLAGRRGPLLPTLLGMALALAGYAAMTSWQAETSYLVMGWQLVLAGAGLGLALAPAADTLIAAADDTQRGGAAALVIALRLTGMTVGVAVLTIYGLGRQDELRRLGATSAAASSDPGGFLLEVAAQVIGETFIFGAVACGLALLAVAWLRERKEHVV